MPFLAIFPYQKIKSPAMARCLGLLLVVAVVVAQGEGTGEAARGGGG